MNHMGVASRYTHALVRECRPRHERCSVRSLADRAMTVRNAIERAGDLEANGAAQACAGDGVLTHPRIVPEDATRR